MISKAEYLKMLVTAAYDGTFPSKDEKTCLYRGPDNKKCAVGLLVTDEEFDRDPSCNSVLVTDLFEKFGIDLTQRVEGMTLEDFIRIQVSHDNRAFIKPWDAEAFVKELQYMDCFQGVKNEAY